MFTAAKIRNIFQSNKLFRVNMRIWSPLLTFRISVKKKTGLRFSLHYSCDTGLSPVTSYINNLHVKR